MTVKINCASSIAKLSDWLKNPTLVSQPMRNKTKTNRILYARFFPRFEQVTGINNSDWFIRLFAPVLLLGVITFVLVYRQSSISTPELFSFEMTEQEKSSGEP